MLQNGLEVFAPMPSLLSPTGIDLSRARAIDGGDIGAIAFDQGRAVGTGQTYLLTETGVGGSEVHRRATAIQQGSEWVRYGLETETFGFDFATDLRGRAEVVAIGVDNGVTRTHVTYAVRAQDLTFVEGESQAAGFPLTMRIVLRGEDGNIVGRTAVSRTFTVPKPVAGRYIQGVESIPILAPVRSAELVVQESSERGMHVVIGDLRTPALEDPRPALSDLVVGSRRWGLNWSTATDTIWFSPSALFHPLEPMEVAFEVYGIPAGTGFQSEVQVIRRRGALAKVIGGEDVRFTLGFSEVSSGQIHRVRRMLDLEQLEDGDYVVVVTVKGSGGEVLRREKGVRIFNP